jgi:hypothetical protein
MLWHPAQVHAARRQENRGIPNLELGHYSQQMEHSNGHHEGFLSPNTATYVELLSAAGLVASAADQRRTLGILNNVHTSYSEVLRITSPLL